MQYGHNNSVIGYVPGPNDVWALGVILLNLLFGKNPWFEAHYTDAIFSAFAGHNPNILRQQFNLTPEFDAVLRRAFDLDPRRRCTVSDLKALVDSVPKFVSSTPFSIPAPVKPTIIPNDSVLCGPGALVPPGLPLPVLPSLAPISSRKRRSSQQHNQRPVSSATTVFSTSSHTQNHIQQQQNHGRTQRLSVASSASSDDVDIFSAVSRRVSNGGQSGRAGGQQVASSARTSMSYPDHRSYMQSDVLTEEDERERSPSVHQEHEHLHHEHHDGENMDDVHHHDAHHVAHEAASVDTAGSAVVTSPEKRKSRVMHPSSDGVSIHSIGPGETRREPEEDEHEEEEEYYRREMLRQRMADEFAEKMMMGEEGARSSMESVVEVVLEPKVADEVMDIVAENEQNRIPETEHLQVVPDMDVDEDEDDEDGQAQAAPAEKIISIVEVPPTPSSTTSSTTSNGDASFIRTRDSGYNSAVGSPSRPDSTGSSQDVVAPKPISKKDIGLRSVVAAKAAEKATSVMVEEDQSASSKSIKHSVSAAPSNITTITVTTSATTTTTSNSNTQEDLEAIRENAATPTPSTVPRRPPSPLTWFAPKMVRESPGRVSGLPRFNLLKRDNGAGMGGSGSGSGVIGMLGIRRRGQSGNGSRRRTPTPTRGAGSNEDSGATNHERPASPFPLRNANGGSSPRHSISSVTSSNGGDSNAMGGQQETNGSLAESGLGSFNNGTTRKSTRKRRSLKSLKSIRSLQDLKDAWNGLVHGKPEADNASSVGSLDGAIEGSEANRSSTPAHEGAVGDNHGYGNTVVAPVPGKKQWPVQFGTIGSLRRPQAGTLNASSSVDSGFLASSPIVPGARVVAASFTSSTQDGKTESRMSESEKSAPSPVEAEGASKASDAMAVENAAELNAESPKVAKSVMKELESTSVVPTVDTSVKAKSSSTPVSPVAPAAEPQETTDAAVTSPQLSKPTPAIRRRSSASVLLEKAKTSLMNLSPKKSDSSTDSDKLTSSTVSVNVLGGNTQTSDNGVVTSTATPSSPKPSSIPGSPASLAGSGTGKLGVVGIWKRRSTLSK
jgi:hypothetical protein